MQFVISEARDAVRKGSISHDVYTNDSKQGLCLRTLLLRMIYFSDAISESNPRVIDDTRARRLANDLKRCSYYETCATYGLNVERVFQDGKIEA